MKKDSIEQVESSITEELEVPFNAALKRHGFRIMMVFGCVFPSYKPTVARSAAMQMPVLGHPEG